MRILALLTDGYGVHGGIALYNRDLMEAMSSHPSVQSISVLPRRILRQFEAPPDRIDHRVEASRGGLAFLQAAAAEAFFRERPDLIFCGHIHLVPVAWALRMRWRSPILTGLHGIEAWQRTGRFLVDRVVLGIDRFFSVSEVTRSRFCAWSRVPAGRIELLPNAIHLDRYGIGPASEAVTTRYGLAGRRVLLTLGRLVSNDRAKGFDEVLDVLPEIRARVPNVLYVIAGDGPYRAALEAKVVARGLSDHVMFTGFVPEDEKADLYRAADVYVMTSRGEGFGFVFLESMACGTPCIASSVDGSREAVRNGALGTIVDPGDGNAIVDAIMKALSQPKRIPEGLEYFAYSAFRERVHTLIDSFSGLEDAVA